MKNQNQVSNPSFQTNAAHAPALKMIELHMQEGNPIWINASEISYIYGKGSGTVISMGNASYPGIVVAEDVKSVLEQMGIVKG